MNSDAATRAFDIRIDRELTHPQVIALLDEHLAGMRAASPPECVFALDLDGLRRPEITFLTAWRRPADAPPGARTEDVGELVAMGALKELTPTTAFGGGHGELKSMRTSARHLRQGAAQAILTELLHLARQRGYARVSLETGSTPPFDAAIAMYRRFGFVECGPFADYREDPFSRFMRLDLACPLASYQAMGAMKSEGDTTTSPHASLGFPAPELVATLRSVAHLFGPRKKRCGIYMLVFADSSIYIGQAIDAVRRFAQHRQTYNDIDAFAFAPVAASRLDETERTMIQLAERGGHVLRNTMFVSNIHVETDLDGLLSPEEQQRWLAAPVHVNQLGEHARQALAASHRARFQSRYEVFLKSPLSDWVLDLLTDYVECAIPHPSLTEYTFWALSCMPGTNSYTYPRFCTLSVGVMEVFVLGHLRGHPDLPWGFVNVACDVLDREFGSRSGFEQAFPAVEVMPSDYRDAGPFQVRLWPRLEQAGVEPLELLLQHPGVQRAAAALVLRVMRKRATIYGKYHCKQMADTVLDRLEDVESH
jgi:putative acetyltransferase